MENTLAAGVLDTLGTYISLTTILDQISIVEGLTGGNVWFPRDS
jgi:hypothetical protein